MKKIIIAPDKFKGSLSSIEFCTIAETYLKKEFPNIEIIKLPLSDGGDGWVEVMQHYCKGSIFSAQVHDPLMRPIQAKYLYLPNEQKAFIEMAEASGLHLLRTQEYNPMLTSSFGTGELILHAIGKGAKHIVLGLGGSATNDAGMGMARALGYKFQDKQGNELEGNGGQLQKIEKIIFPDNLKLLRGIRFDIASDVNNPLYGTQGAAHIYAPQKGADNKMVLALDTGLQHFNKILKRDFQKDYRAAIGAGAAGGLGAGALFFLNADAKSGIEIILKQSDFETMIADADWIISGEGHFDKQSFSGKVIGGILKTKKRQKLALICGKIDLNALELAEVEIDFSYEFMAHAKNKEDALQNSEKYLKQALESFLHQINCK